MKHADFVERQYTFLRDAAQNDTDFAVAWAHGMTDAELDAVSGAPYSASLLALITELKKSEPPEWAVVSRALQSSLDGRGGDMVVNDDDIFSVPDSNPPCWSSGVTGLDRDHGGLCGVTTVVGRTGVGKTTFALGSAMRAVRDGWCVVYVNVELDRGTVAGHAKRAARTLGLVPEARKRFRVMNVGRGVKFEDIVKTCREWLDTHKCRVLLVLDSINTIADAISGGDYFGTLNRLQHVVLDARRATGGGFGALVMSEENKAGEVKGVKGSFLSDMVVRVEAGEQPLEVDISVTKGRYSGRGEYSGLVRSIEAGTFCDPNEQAPALTDADNLEGF